MKKRGVVMIKSIWSENCVLPQFEKLKGEHKTEVLIIGGGMCGLLCAYYLRKANIDHILVEGDTIASGITKNTTAKITSQHSLIYDKTLKSYGKEKAQMYLDANNRALLEFEKLCKNIECDFSKKDAYTYSLTDREKIEREVRAVNSLGFDAEFEKNLELPFSVAGAIRFKNQAQFNPLKFIAALCKDLNIYENTFVRDITPKCAITDSAKITFKKVIVATHFPFINKHGSYFLKLYQHRSYVSAFENVPLVNAMYVDEDKKGLSFRSYENFLLIGGEGHRTGKESDAWEGIRRFAQNHYDAAKLKYQWAAQDTMSLDSIPYIGHYSKNTPDMYVAAGFNKWGMTSSMVSAMLLCDMVQEKENFFAEVFSPQRSLLKPQLAINGIETTLNFLSPTVKRCPHLGCALKWNKAERSWDCPCHGSRFQENGKLIDNPATGDANV